MIEGSLPIPTATFTAVIQAKFPPWPAEPFEKHGVQPQGSGEQEMGDL